MQIKFKPLLAAASILFSLTTMQAQAADQPAWVGPYKVKSVELQAGGNVYVGFYGDTPNLGCTAYDNGYVQLNSSHAHFDHVLKMMIAAQLSGAKIYSHIMGCGNFYPLLSNARLTH